MGGLRSGWRDTAGAWVYFPVGHEGSEGVGGSEVYTRTTKKTELLLTERLSVDRGGRGPGPFGPSVARQTSEQRVQVASTYESLGFKRGLGLERTPQP